MLLLGGSTLEPCHVSAASPLHQRQPNQGPAGQGTPLSSSLRVIGVVEEGFFIPGGGNAHRGLQMLRQAVESGGTCLGMAGSASSAAQVARLCGLAASLPCLRVLELTHFPMRVIDGVAEALRISAGE